LEVLGNFLVPKGDVTFTVVNDWSEFSVSAEVGHEGVHAVDTRDEIEDEMLGGLFVLSFYDILDGLAEDGGETVAHGGMSKGILMVATVGGPGRVVWVDPGWGARIESLYFLFGRKMAKMEGYLVDFVASGGGGS